MINNTDEIKIAVKQNPINTFYIEFCGGVKYKNSKDKYSCVFCNSVDNMSENKKDNTMHCFGCGTSVDHINLVQNLKGTNFIESLKIVAKYYGYEYCFDNQETLAETSDEIKLRKEKFEVLQKERQKNQEIADKKLLLEKEEVIKKLTIDAKVYSDELINNWNKYKSVVEKIIPNQSIILDRYRYRLLGWDIVHDSLVILTYDCDACTNITHQQKYQWDDTLKKHDKTKRKDGKWFNAYNCTISAFCKDIVIKDNDTYILTEGEKDAISIINIEAAATTLGGATNRWDNHKEFLRDKIVYIWFDNNEAGYLNAMKRYRELEDITKNIYIVLFFNIDSKLPLKYDVSDFIKDNKIDNYEQLMNKIDYSSHNLTNNIINEIGEYIGIDDLEEFYQLSSQKEIYSIFKEYRKLDKNKNPINILKVKGELDIKHSKSLIEILSTQQNTKAYSLIKENIVKTHLSLNEQITYNELEDAFKELMKIQPKLLANYSQNHMKDMIDSFLLMTKKTGYTIGRYRESLVLWNGTYHQSISESQLSEFILNHWFKLAKVDSKKQILRNAKELVENVKAMGIDINDIKLKFKDKRILNLQNGTLIITKRGKTIFKPIHEKNDGATNILDFNYDKKATCLKWLKFINRILPNKDEQEALMQYIGYCLLPSHDYETFLLLYGKSGSNGKSVIMDTVSNFFGNDNISSLDLQQFHGHELEAISNKFINIGTEIDSKSLSNGQFSMLKKIVSPKDKININGKHKTPYQIEAFEKPKLIFSANSKPKQGIDDAVFRRMLLLTFDSEIKDSEKVRDLSDRFKDELAGILNLALKNLQILIKNGTFTKSDRMKADIESYKDEVNPMRKYIEDNITLDKNSIIPKQLLYAHYKSWIDENGYKPLGESQFSKKLQDEMTDITASKNAITIKHQYLSDRSRVYGGIFCNSLYPDFEFKDHMVQTNSINFDKDTKAVLVNQD